MLWMFGQWLCLMVLMPPLLLLLGIRTSAIEGGGAQAALHLRAGMAGLWIASAVAMLAGSAVLAAFGRTALDHLPGRWPILPCVVAAGGVMCLVVSTSREVVSAMDTSLGDNRWVAGVTIVWSIAVANVCNTVWTVARERWNIFAPAPSMPRP